MSPNYWTAAHIREAFERFGALGGEDDPSADHLLAYLQGDLDGLAPDGKPAIARWLETANTLDMIVTIERQDAQYAASIRVPGNPMVHGISFGPLDGALEFAREHLTRPL